jgi:hypothetical protein
VAHVHKQVGTSAEVLVPSGAGIEMAADEVELISTGRTGGWAAMRGESLCVAAAHSM